jgi:ATP-binding cassette subfamily C protein CydC
MSDLLRLLRLFRPYWGWITLGTLLSFATLLANVGLMAISGWFISAMAIAGAAGVSMNYFTPAAIIRFFAIVRTVGRYLERLVTHEATFRMLAQLRRWFFEHLEPLAPARLQSFRSGDLLSRIRADIDTLENFYLRILAPLLVAGLGSIASIVFLGSFHPLMGLVEGILLVCAGVITPIMITRLASEPGKRSVQNAAKLRASTVDGLQGMGELLIYGAANSHAQQIHTLSKDLIRDQQQLAQYTGISQGVMIFFAHLTMIGILIIAISMVNQKQLSPAYIATLALFALASFEAILPLPMAFQSLGETLSAARRIFSIIDAEPEVSEPSVEPDTLNTCAIHLQNISFRYDKQDRNTLQNISFDLPPGKKLAIVGPTGSGKSTLIDLLLRFRQAASGQIEFAGHPLEAWSGDTMRRHIAVVPQRTHLFNTTIRNNLMLANLEADTHAMENACRIAQIHDFIVSQPQAYDTFVGEAGVKLSGGQARRITIARAILKDAPILILDEPGEDLDASTEYATLQALLDSLGNQQSLLLITHRLTGLDTMDEILVLESGCIVERGHHQNLINTGKRYRSLFENFGELA